MAVPSWEDVIVRQMLFAGLSAVRITEDGGSLFEAMRRSDEESAKKHQDLVMRVVRKIQATLYTYVPA